MKGVRYTAKQVANWFINRFNQDVPNGGEYLTQLKLQKLMYFAQGFSLALENTALFKGDIVHRQYGPVVADLASYFMANNQGADPIKNLIPADKIEFTKKDEALLESVYKRFGQFSAYKLVEISHMTTPWQETEEGEIISLSAIKKFFAESF